MPSTAHGHLRRGRETGMERERGVGAGGGGVVRGVGGRERHGDRDTERQR